MLIDIGTGSAPIVDGKNDTLSYADNDGVAHQIDLAERAQSTLPSSGSPTRKFRYVGNRSLGGAPWSVSIWGDPPVIFHFLSYAAAYEHLLLPLKQAHFLTYDMT